MYYNTVPWYREFVQFVYQKLDSSVHMYE